MSTPTLATKLSVPPRRADWVLRPRLIRQLDQGMERRLTLVSAPAGFGKTTLLASWLHALGDRPQPGPRVSWLSLEEDDNDPVRFMAHFISALQIIDPALGQRVRPFLDTPFVPELTNLMTMLINDLAQFSGVSLLALDDYHVIRNPELQSAVSFFLEHLPPHSHLILATREEPQLPLPRLRARWQVTELRLHDLRFTREETATFLNCTMGLELTEEAARALEDHTEGWIAGLQMAALSLRGRFAFEPNDDEKPIDIHAIDAVGDGQREIIDYLGAEVVRQQTSEIRDFLRTTAILDRFNASLCNAVTGRNDGVAMLDRLERANLFLIPLDHQRQWYRYHHLFADFLRTETDEIERRLLHSRASHWFEQHSLMSEAIKHALSACDYDNAVRLIRRGAEVWNCDGGFGTLLGWVNALPEEIVKAHSDLLVHKGWIPYLRGELQTAEQYAALAVERQRPDDSPIHKGMLLGFRAHLAINRDEPLQAQRFAEEALELLGDTESFYRTVALSHLGKAQRLVGDRQAAIQTLRQAISLGQRLKHHLITLEALGYLTHLLYQQGHLREAIISCEEAARRYIDARGRPLPVAGMVYVPLGMLYYEINDLQRAEYHLTTGIDLCRRMGTVYPTLIGQRTLAKLYFAFGRLEAVWETLAEARELASRSQNPRRTRLVNSVTAELQLRQGHISAAAMTLRDLPACNRDRSEQENITYARLLLAQGQSDAALRLLGQLEKSALRQGRQGSLITVYLLQAIAHQHMHNDTEAVRCIERSVCMAAPEGYRRTFLDEGSSAETLLASRNHIAPDFVPGLLEAFAVTSSGLTGRSVQPLVDPLSRTQLAILRLVADGLSNRDIAAQVHITEGTTKWHLNQIYGKLNVNSRTQAVARARSLDLL
ncbi:MAG: hypothetical protein KIT57_16445 [Blastocatellales bacterium]|nr:hypothetical protein [Blastocatellales bacterium]